MSLSVYIKEGTVNGEVFAEFVDKFLLSCLMLFNGINARSVVVMDNVISVVVMNNVISVDNVISVVVMDNVRSVPTLFS